MSAKVISIFKSARDDLLFLPTARRIFLQKSCNYYRLPATVMEVYSRNCRQFYVIGIIKPNHVQELLEASFFLTSFNLIRASTGDMVLMSIMSKRSLASLNLGSISKRLSW